MLLAGRKRKDVEEMLGGRRWWPFIATG